LSSEEKLESITKPEEEIVNEKGQRIVEVEEKQKPKKKDEKKLTVDNGKVKSKADLLLEQYHEIIEKQPDNTQELDVHHETKGQEIEKELGLHDYVISDKEIQQDVADYQKRRIAYFKLESKKEWHKIPIFKKWDTNGDSIYRLVSYRFHDYPYEVSEAVDQIRAEYEDATKVKTTFDLIKIFRDETSRSASVRASTAKHKWIDTGRTFILHMKDEEFKKAHKDFILLVIDTAMYRQETFIPNLPIESRDSSADDQSAQPDSQRQSGIQ
jgi:hypothetical protein